MSQKPTSGKPHLCLCALASGSRGNAVYVSDGQTSILLDAGLSAKEVERRLSVHGIDPGRINALVLSHEHVDHARGVGIFSRRFDLPVYVTRPTHAKAAGILGSIGDLRHFVSGTAFSIGSLALHPFPVSHDAADPVGFTIKSKGLKVAVATDLGIATEMVRQHLKDASAILLESNHDPKMLEQGPYPWPVKQRVAGRMGHLSNEAARDLLASILSDRLSHVILGHISQTNNLPEKARSVVAQAISGHPARLWVASQDACGALVSVTYPDA